MDQFTGKESDWNYAKSYLQRIDEQFRMANAASLQSNFDLWLVCLHNVHGELEPRMVRNAKVDTEKDGKIVKDTENEMSRAKALCDAAKTVVDSKRKGSMQVDVWTVREKLREYGVYLKEVMRRRGLDMPNKQDPGSALLN